VFSGLSALVENLFVIVKTEAFACIREGVDCSLRRAFTVGVLDAQEELSSGNACAEKPVEDGGPDISNVYMPRRRRERI